MTLVGFKRATIGIFGSDGTVTEKIIVEGKAEEGATTTAEITGLSKEATRVYGSDIAYYVSQRGTGDVSVNLGLLDLPDAANDKILGYKTTSEGISYIGNDTEAPYVAIMLESGNLQGEKAMLGFFKGKISKESITLNTLNNEAFTPEAETYVFSAIEDTKEGESFGQVVGKYVGDVQESIKKLENQVFPTSLPVG